MPISELFVPNSKLFVPDSKLFVPDSQLLCLVVSCVLVTGCAADCVHGAALYRQHWLDYTVTRQLQKVCSKC